MHSSPCLQTNQQYILPSFHTYSRSSPSGKTASEDVPMEDNPAYGEVNLYDTVKDPKENCESC